MEKFLIESDKGVAGSKGMEVSEVLATLLHAFLAVWDNEKFSIDMEKAAEGVIDVMRDCEITEEDAEDKLNELIKKLFQSGLKEDGEA